MDSEKLECQKYKGVVEPNAVVTMIKHPVLSINVAKNWNYLQFRNITAESVNEICE